jgi:tetratricopeptide (TPR) repeat protein
MTLTRKTQIVLVAISICLFVLLFLAPKTHTGKSEDKPKESAPLATIEPFLNMVTKTLSVEDKKAYDALLASATASSVDTAFIPVVQYWDKLKRPDLASYFVEKIAVKKQQSSAFLKAGDRYYFSVRFIKDNNEIPVLYQSAMRCYQTALDKDAKNIDAKIQLAACYVEGTQDPMKGIALLREVEKTDSNNVKLQLNFAFFSVKSQQWDRAIRRFEKVLQIDPLYIEAYLHLADAYEQQGDKNKTIEMLQKYASLTDDAMAKQEVLKYIDQLKK